MQQLESVPTEPIDIGGRDATFEAQVALELPRR